MKTVRIIFSPEAEEVYKYLNKQAPFSKIENSILKAFHNKSEFIKANPHYGEPVKKKKRIYGVYKKKYGVTNLFYVTLPNFWRMFYTLTDGESKVEVVAFVLDIMDHKRYDKKRKR